MKRGKIMICLTYKAKKEIKEFLKNSLKFVLIVITGTSIASTIAFVITGIPYLLGANFNPLDITMTLYAGIMSIPTFIIIIFIVLEWLYYAFKKC